MYRRNPFVSFMLNFTNLHIAVSAIFPMTVFIYILTLKEEKRLSIGIIRADSFVMTARATCMEEE